MEAYTSFEMIIEGKPVYNVLKKLIIDAYTADLVEEFNDKSCRIKFVQLAALEDDIVKFSETFTDLVHYAFTKANSESAFMKIKYRIDDMTEFYSYGSKRWFSIEKDGGELFFKETDNYDF